MIFPSTIFRSIRLSRSALFVLCFGVISQIVSAAESPNPESSQPGLPAAGGEPIVKIGKDMEELAKRFAETSRDDDPRATQLKERIIVQLDALLEQLQKQSQRQPAGGQSSSGARPGQQQDSRTSLGSEGPRGLTVSGETKDSQGPSRESSQRIGKAAPEINLAQLLEVVKDVWGHLPEKERERLRQHAADQVVPGHDLAVEKYFRRLAAESTEDADSQ